VLSQSRVVLICLLSFVLALIAQILFTEFYKQMIDYIMSFFVSLEVCKGGDDLQCLQAIQTYELAYSVCYYAFILFCFTGVSYLATQILSRSKIINLKSALPLVIGIYLVPFISAYFASATSIGASLFHFATLAFGFILAARRHKQNAI